jgi:hypothetical protein
MPSAPFVADVERIFSKSRGEHPGLLLSEMIEKIVLNRPYTYVRRAMDGLHT